jgi:hypothetical protein
MAARKARVEGAAATPKAERPSVPFRALVAQFREARPEVWEEIALTPLQHGIEVIAEHLERL